MTVDISDPEILDVPGFVRSCVERAGGVVEEARAGRLDALLPPQLEAAAGDRSWVRLALSTDDLEDGAEPAMLGSPFMDALIAFASARGANAVGYLPAGRLKRKGLREEVERTLLFSNCRTRHEYDEPDVRLAATAQFDFKVAFLSEERRERLYVIPVNLVSNHVHPSLAEHLAGLKVEAEPAVRFPETAYETACRDLSQRVAEEAARHQIRLAQRFAVEWARISEYYGKVIADLERRRVRERWRAAAGAAGREAPASHGARDTPAVGGEPEAIARGSATADPLAQKIESAHRERERKLRELGETYGLRTRARLSSLRCLW